MKLYIGGLAYSVTENELEEAFAQHGEVASAVIIKDRDTGQSKGFGFVEMPNGPEAENAMKALNGQLLGGRSMVVNEARPQGERRTGGGGGGGGGGYRRSY